MALKKKIAKTEYEAVPDLLKDLYVADGDQYRLDLDDWEPPKPTDDTAELKRALDREREAAKNAKKQLSELQKKLEEESTLTARKAGDIETLEKSWASKMDKLQKDMQKNLEQKDQFIRATLVDNVAVHIATEIAGSNAEILMPHIRSRLKADLESDTPITRVLDAQGNISSLSPSELGQEFVANPKFAAIVVASKASGSGAPDSVNGGRDSVTFDEKSVDFSKMAPKDFARHIKAKAEGRLNQM